ncbi:hypothetical protein M0802_000840 [Mischocyttarus mexicanus]|nr:hypothetical protein M0802_000840 [Mischocyttarus mexicanus]
MMIEYPAQSGLVEFLWKVTPSIETPAEQLYTFRLVETQQPYRFDWFRGGGPQPVAPARRRSPSLPEKRRENTRDRRKENELKLGSPLRLQPSW